MEELKIIYYFTLKEYKNTYIYVYILINIVFHILFNAKASIHFLRLVISVSHLITLSILSEFFAEIL